MEERGVDQEAGSKGGKLEFTVSGVDWDKSEGMAKADEKMRPLETGRPWLLVMLSTHIPIS